MIASDYVVALLLMKPSIKAMNTESINYFQWVWSFHEQVNEILREETQTQILDKKGKSQELEDNISPECENDTLQEFGHDI